MKHITKVTRPAPALGISIGPLAKWINRNPGWPYRSFNDFPHTNNNVKGDWFPIRLPGFPIINPL